MQRFDEFEQSPPASSDDRPNRTPWPPILYAGVLAVSYLLERAIPLSSMPRHGALQTLGWAVFALGVVIGLAGILQFRTLGTPVDPTGQAKHLATAGIYAFSRNPMYLGAVTGLIGLAFALTSAWLLILSLLLPLALRKLAIEPEEAYLTRRFGSAYEGYMSRVRRWL